MRWESFNQQVNLVTRIKEQLNKMAGTRRERRKVGGGRGREGNEQEDTEEQEKDT